MRCFLISGPPYGTTETPFTFIRNGEKFYRTRTRQPSQAVMQAALHSHSFSRHFIHRLTIA